MQQLALPDKDSLQFRVLQMYAALGLCRIILKKLGFEIAPAAPGNRFARTEKKERKQKKVESKRLALVAALEGEPLAQWLPHIQQVFIDFICFPSNFGEDGLAPPQEDDLAQKERVALLPFKQHELPLVFLKRSGLFADNHSIVNLLMKRLKNPQGMYQPSMCMQILTYIFQADGRNLTMTLVNMLFRESSSVNSYCTTQEAESYRSYQVVRPTEGSIARPGRVCAAMIFPPLP